MSLRKAAFFAALCAMALMGVVSSASAATFVRQDTSGGGSDILTSGSKISAGLASGTHSTLTSNLGNVTCPTASFTGTVGASGGATVPYTLNTLTFTNCSDSVPFISITSCHGTTPYTGTITATTSPVGGSLTVNGLAVHCYSGSTLQCTFTANAGQVGQGTNSTGNLVFSNVLATGSGSFCPSSGSFHATFGPVVADGTTNRITITES